MYFRKNFHILHHTLGSVLGHVIWPSVFFFWETLGEDSIIDFSVGRDIEMMDCIYVSVLKD
jgi:hypothetical protein